MGKKEKKSSKKKEKKVKKQKMNSDDELGLLPEDYGMVDPTDHQSKAFEKAFGMSSLTGGTKLMEARDLDQPEHVPWVVRGQELPTTWECPKCGTQNFKRAEECKKCKR